jgi:energy-coupling factor transporter ATP-binding protein EcfA2
MFLAELELENVRAIEHLRISFVTEEGQTRKWTVLIGQNGCGKSTVLRSAALLMAGSEGISELIGTPDSWIRLKQKSCRFRAKLVTAQNDSRNIEFTLKRGDELRDVFERNRATLKAIDNALAKAFRNYMTVGYGVSRRFSPIGQITKPETFRTPRAQCVATMFSSDATLQPLQNWIMDIHYRRSSSGLGIVKNTLRELLPGVAFHKIDRLNKSIYFKTPDGIVPLEQLSDGYQNVAAWCGDLVYRVMEMNLNYKNPLQARGLLLIDEIDLHLHPVWQRNLRDYLDSKFPNLQILATTHSALTAQQCGQGELFFLQRDARWKVSLQQFAGEPRKMMVHQLLLSPMFGLHTLDSREIQVKKDALRTLKRTSKKNRTSKSRVRLRTLKRELSDMPDWSIHSFADDEELELLRDIRAELSSSNGRGGKPQLKKARV